MFATIAGSDRAAFDRMTFRPRMMIPTLDLDLTVDLLGHQHFAPLLIGPVAEQRRYHVEGELATVRGASDARAVVICSSRSSVSFGEIAAQAKTPLWLSIYADEAAGAERKLQEAKAAGCRALCVTVGAGGGARAATPSRVNWTAIEHLRKLAGLPVVVKGVTTDADALAAIDHGVQGIVVSTHGMAAAAGAAPIEVLASIADRVRGKTAVLVDGSFRRGSDILKALILGAQAVIVARPVMWGLAAYGADGVRAMIEMLQSDLARQMGAIGAPNPSQLTRDMVRIHKR